MRTLADVLVDFGKPAHRDPLAAEPMDFGLPETDLPDPEPGPDVDALIAEAVADAETAVSARLQGEFAETLESERAAHAEQLEQLRARLGEEAGSALKQQLAALEDNLVGLTASVAARILGPVLSADLQAKAVDGLGAIIRDAIRDSGAVRIRVRGPLSLFEALESAVGEHSGRIEYTETGDFDLTVGIDESLYETRLADWSNSLAEALQ